MEIQTWFVPTSYGDIRLKAKSKNLTQVEICKLTRSELRAVQALKDHSLSPGLFKTAWATNEEWMAIVGAFEIGQSELHTIDLRAPIARVERVLTKELRRDRRVVTIASCKPGEYVELRAEIPPELTHGTSPHREPASGPEDEPKPAKKAEKAVAVTTQVPIVGCPPPNFENARVRASEVLRSFLLPEQIRDFETRQQFVTVGGMTGHRYAITSRHCRSLLGQYQRTVYDLDEGRPLCVHDWEIPAPEEMLTLHLLLSLPQYEPYMREMQA